MKALQWADDDRKRDAFDRFIHGDDDAFDEILRDNPELMAGLRPDPLDPEPEDEEETVTYPDVWDRMGDRVVIWSCIAALALFWGAPIALAVWAVNR